MEAILLVWSEIWALARLETRSPRAREKVRLVAFPAWGDGIADLRIWFSAPTGFRSGATRSVTCDFRVSGWVVADRPSI
jgi:hypothetical protein